MEVWVRSQAKTELMLVKKLYIDDIGEPKNYCIESEGVLLGTYKSLERALEVLDEIQNRLNIRHNDRTGAEFIVISEIVPVIYEMPKE